MQIKIDPEFRQNPLDPLQQQVGYLCIERLSNVGVRYNHPLQLEQSFLAEINPKLEILLNYF